MHKEVYFLLHKASLAIYPSLDTVGKLYSRALQISDYQDIFWDPKAEMEGDGQKVKIVSYLDTPDSLWFHFFSEEEKSVSGDSNIYWGTSYTTSVENAIDRINNIFTNIDVMPIKKINRAKFIVMLSGYKKLLEIFEKTDEIVMDFTYPEWPKINEMKTRYFTEEYKYKLLGES